MSISEAKAQYEKYGKPVGVRLPAADVRRLEQMAEADGERTVASLIRLAVKRFLEAKHAK